MGSAIIRANVDLDPCRHMASLGHNKLTACTPIDRFSKSSAGHLYE